MWKSSLFALHKGLKSKTFFPHLMITSTSCGVKSEYKTELDSAKSINWIIESISQLDDFIMFIIWVL